MNRDSLYQSSDEETIEGSTSQQIHQRLSCPSCKATNFPNLSKLNKHRKSHDKPYRCLALGCAKHFGQRQHLDRHTQSKHGSLTNSTKFYHCTVDSCKYSSTSLQNKRFARADQVKEHIKDFGHYGPHSANDRLRRPGQPLFAEHIITVYFEEWTSDGSEWPRRILLSCRYNSLDTKLWHTDDTAEIYMRVGSANSMEGKEYFECSISDCYYQSRPPESIDKTVFKTLGGLKEHQIRAHFLQPAQAYWPTSQLLSKPPEECGSTSHLIETQPSTSFREDPSFVEDDFLHSPGETFDSMDWTPFTDLSGGEVVISYPVCQNETAQSQQEDRSTLPSMEDTSALYSPSQSSCSGSMKVNYGYPDPNGTEGSYPASSDSRVSPAPSMSECIPSQNKITCSIFGCNKEFRRKGDMQRHVETVHSMFASFSCPVCSRQFRRKDKVNDHLKNSHKIVPDSEFMKARSVFASAPLDVLGVETLEGNMLDRGSFSGVQSGFEGPYNMYFDGNYQ